MFEEIKTAFVAYRTAHGHKAAEELVAKHGGRQLGNVPEESWPALAKDLGISPAVALEHHSRGRGPMTPQETRDALNAMAPAAFDKFNDWRRRGNDDESA